MGPRLLFLLLLTAAPLEAAVLHYGAAQRQIIADGAFALPAAEFGGFDDAVSAPGGLAEGYAAQTSWLGPQSVSINTRAGGSSVQGMSIMILRITLTEAAAWQCRATFSLLGDSGFACVSIVNLPQRDTVLLHETAGDPPGQNMFRTWSASGILTPGEYELEAILYSGGAGSPHSGSLEMIFTIPEPGVSLLLAAAALIQPRCRAGQNKTRRA